jgi:hypothetical protein
MQGSLLILSASEPPRRACLFGQASLARHLAVTLFQDRAELCNKVLPNRFKAQLRSWAWKRAKKRALGGRAGRILVHPDRPPGRNKD